LNSKLLKLIWRWLEPALIILFLVASEELVVQLFPNALRYLTVIVLIAGRWKHFLYVATRDKILWLLVGLGAASYFWSAAPDYTSDEMKAVFRSVLFAAYLATRYTPKEQMRIFAWSCGLAALLSLYYALLQPSIGTTVTNDQDVWRGIYIHKQYLGRTMTLGAMVFFITALDSRKKRWLWLMGFGLALAMIWFSQSKTSLVLLILSLSMLPLFTVVKQNYKLQTVLLIVTSLIGGFLAIFLISNFQSIVVDDLGKDTTLSGRVPVWNLAIQKGSEQPLFGYGYAGFWTSDESDSIINSTWASDEDRSTRFHAHNGFIDIFLQLGWAGLTVFILNFSLVFLRIVKLLTITKAMEYYYMLQILILMLLFNITESCTILSQGNVIWILYVSIAFSTALQLSRMQSHDQTDLNLSSFNKEKIDESAVY
jgi:exopolysaccharide production protein ExoQ